MSKTKMLVSDALNHYEKSLRSLPGVLSIHAGFDMGVPVIIATVSSNSSDLGKKISSIARGVEIRVIPVDEKKLRRTDKAVERRTVPATVNNVGQFANAATDPENETLDTGLSKCIDTSHCAANHLENGAEKDRVQHNRNGIAALFFFALYNLKVPMILLFAATIALYLISSTYRNIPDIVPQIGAETTEGVIITAGKPYEAPSGSGNVTQQIAVRFDVNGRDMVFTERVPLVKSLSYIVNMSVAFYSDRDTVPVSYYVKDPLGTAKVFSTASPPNLTVLYIIILALFCLSIFLTWRRWRKR